EGVARTLAPLHAKGIAHRGIRPDQLFRRDGDAHVGLGLPNWEADLEDRPPDALKSPYLAPEYATGRASPRSDMYALGVTAIHLLTGLQGSELARAARDPGGRKDRFGLTAGCFDILTALLAEETIKRVASAGQLLDLLGRANLEAHGGASGGAAAGAAAPPHPEGGGLLDDVERHLRAAGLSGVGAERFAARLRKHRGEQAGGTDKRKVALLAGLLALLALAATRARGLARAIAEPALRAKILFAMGLGVTAVAGGGVVLARLGGQPERRQEIVHALPTPVTGANADAVAAAQAGHKDLLARAGATPDYEVVRELPAGPEPAADPGRPAGQAASPPPDLQPDRPPGQPPGQSPGQTPAGPPGKEPARPASAGPYDEVAEPGTDPEDASGLKKKSEFFIRVNKTYKTLTLYHNGQYATQYVVAIGARANTPDGRYSIKKKIANPSYENVPAGDARNPLGTRWLGMDVRYPGGRSIGIHGTNNESSIGQAASGGCIRMKNSEVEQLFDLVPEGTPVEIN
ncbi:MAG: L,D-transpeptidase family protein, partial [Candidatus Sericytochromatia bacterium]|nr:L,D-transpeptidase family protein [Candidatus Tanganyikabacteria bacterium]